MTVAPCPSLRQAVSRREKVHTTQHTTTHIAQHHTTAHSTTPHTHTQRATRNAQRTTHKNTINTITHPHHNIQHKTNNLQTTRSRSTTLYHGPRDSSTQDSSFTAKFFLLWRVHRTGASPHPRMQIHVYNSDSETIREATLVPNNEWGGEGCIGCDIRAGVGVTEL